MREIPSVRDMRITYLALMKSTITYEIIVWVFLRLYCKTLATTKKSKYTDPDCFKKRVKIFNKKCI